MTVESSATALMVAMVQALRDRGCVRSAEVAQAFLAVPRHVFVPPRPLGDVYSCDVVIPTHFDAEGVPVSSSSAPSIMATMLEQLDVHAGMRVLEIGAGTGYNAALLAHLAGPGGHVVAVDFDEQVAVEARENLHEARVSGVEVVTGDGWLGAPGPGRFDRVIVTVGAWEISSHWFEQLRPGGVLVMPLWLRPGLQVCVALVRGSDGFRSREMCACGFMRLRGPHAGPDAHVVVPGWGDRIDGATTDREWIAALELATTERVARLRALISGPVAAAPIALPAPGWTTRLALDAPDAIAFSGRDTMFHFAFGLFAPDGRSLALFDAGMIVSFGDPFCADRLRAVLPTLDALRLADLDLRAVPHPAGEVRDAWVLERPGFDLVVRERSAAK